MANQKFVDSCPLTETAFINAATRLNCTEDENGRSQYVCVPQKDKSALVEYCYGDTVGLFEKGNKCIHLLTAGGNTVLRFEFEDYSSNTRYAEYSSFNVGSTSSHYLMTVSGYTGDAGDSMVFYNNAPFSAKDVDHEFQKLRSGL